MIFLGCCRVRFVCFFPLFCRKNVVNLRQKYTDTYGDVMS